MNQHFVAFDMCAHCGHNLEMATGPEVERPQKGDVSICIYCGGVLTYDEQLILRAADSAYILSLPMDQQKEITRISEACKSSLNKLRHDKGEHYAKA